MKVRIIWSDTPLIRSDDFPPSDPMGRQLKKKSQTARGNVLSIVGCEKLDCAEGRICKECAGGVVWGSLGKFRVGGRD